jgi:hypothetical protein
MPQPTRAAKPPNLPELRCFVSQGDFQMLRLFRTSILLLLALTQFAAAAPVRIQDPAKFCGEIFDGASQFKSDELASKIATAIGKPESAEGLEKALGIIHDKKIDYAKKVLDKDFDGALRQIVYYAYVDEIGFLYFRLNFKMTSGGWILANFNFKSETNELFPKDFVER